jgi:hypothetical protein
VFTMRGKLRVERDAPMPNERIATAEQRELIVLGNYILDYLAVSGVESSHD